MLPTQDVCLLTDGNSVLQAAHDGNGRFFFNGYKEESPNCKFPTFNSGKTIERQVERGLHEQYFFDEVRVNGFSGVRSGP